MSDQIDKAQQALDKLKDTLDDELIAAVELRAAKGLEEMDPDELEQLWKSIPPADKDKA